MFTSKVFLVAGSLLAVYFGIAVFQDCFRAISYFPELPSLGWKLYRGILLGGTAAASLYASRQTLARLH